MPVAHVNGIDLHYEDEGSGPPVLLIPGLGGHSGIWVLQRKALSPQYRVLSLDNRGAGRSDVPPGPYTVRQMAEDAAALLDALGIERASIVGWSMGGMVAQELALAHPGKVDRLVLLATSARLQPHVVDWIRFDEELREAGLAGPGRNVWSLPWVAPPRLMMQPEFVPMTLERMATDPYPITSQGFHAQAPAACRHDTLERLHQIGAPTLVLVGAEDVLTPPADAEAMAERIAGARLQVLEQGGHGMPVAEPEAVNAALLVFLAESAPVPAAG